jgi:beta-propeller repeat-containing protein
MDITAKRARRLIGLVFTLLGFTIQTTTIALPSRCSIPSALASPSNSDAGAAIDWLPPASLASEADETTRKRIGEAYGKLPFCFEAGDLTGDPRVRFISRTPSCNLFLTDTEAVLVLPHSGEMRRGNPAIEEQVARPGSLYQGSKPRNSRPNVDVLRMKMVGAKQLPLVEGIDQLHATSNYYVGNNPAAWRTDVPRYAGVRYQNIYPGIDLIYHGNRGDQLDCEIVLKPGARPEAIKFRFEGASKMHFDSREDLIMQIGQNEVRLGRPAVYQEIDGVRRNLAGRFAFNSKREVGFKPGPYDTTQPLVVDRLLSYSTYFGRTAEVANVGFCCVFFSFGATLFVDSNDNLYLIGQTFATDFPTTTNALPKRVESEDQSDIDIVISKIDPSKSGDDSLVYSTYFGGSSSDLLGDAFVDPAGNVFLVGSTDSTDFPTTENAFERGPRLGSMFVARLDTNKSGIDSLVYSTYLGSGGISSQRGFVDSASCVYVAGDTASNNFDTTENAFQKGPRAASRKDTDLFISKIDTSKRGKDSLVYSTYLGGDGDDSVQVALGDPAGNVYIAGRTSSSNFPTTATAFQREPVEESNSFVCRIDAFGNGQDSLVYSTFLGANSGAFPDLTAFVRITTDSAGTIYLTGRTSHDFPTTENAFQKGPRTEKRNDYDGFISKIETTKSGKDSLSYSSYVGGSNDDFVSGLFVGPAQQVYLTGSTSSNDFPTTASAFQRGPKSETNGDVFVTKIDTSRSGQDSLVYSTYLGGGSIESLLRSFVDSSGNVYVAGNTSSNDFPTTGNPFEGPRLGNELGSPFVARIDTSKSGQSSLVYSTYLGGSDFSVIKDFFIDSAGNAYLVGQTASNDFPTRLPLQAINGGLFFEDAFVTKLNPEGRPVYSTYLGGRGFDAALRLVVDSTGNAYVFGLTGSPDFPVTVAGYRTARQSDVSTFITRIGNPAEAGNFRIANVSVVRDTLLVVGEGFIRGAVILVNDQEQRTRLSRQDSTVLMSESAGAHMKVGRKVSIRVRNPDGALSAPVEFIRQKRRIT